MFRFLFSWMLPAKKTPKLVVPAAKSATAPAAKMPTYASAFHPEFAPPAAKRAQAPRRERHKHRTVGRAAHWLDECTSISDVSLPCPYDNAWKNYLAWCRAEELMPLSKGKFIRGVAARVGTHGKAFTGLVLAVPTETLRAVA